MSHLGKLANQGGMNHTFVCGCGFYCAASTQRGCVFKIRLHYKASHPEVDFGKLKSTNEKHDVVDIYGKVENKETLSKALKKQKR